MSIARLSFQGVTAYLVGGLASSTIYNLIGKYDGWEKFTCVFTAIFGDIVGERPLCETHPMRHYCCNDETPLNVLDKLILGAFISIAISFTVKRIFPQHTPEANNNGRDAHNIAAQLLETAARTKEDDTTKPDPTKDLATTDSIEELLKIGGDTNALTTFTAAKDSAPKKEDFDATAASAVTSYGSGSTNNVLALEAFSKENRMVGSALANEIIGGTQLYAKEEDFETRANDGSSVTRGRMQVIKTTRGIVYQSRETTTHRASSIASMST